MGERGGTIVPGLRAHAGLSPTGQEGFRVVRSPSAHRERRLERAPRADDPRRPPPPRGAGCEVRQSTREYAGERRRRPRCRAPGFVVTVPNDGTSNISRAVPRHGLQDDAVRRLADLRRPDHLAGEPRDPLPILQPMPATARSSATFGKLVGSAGVRSLVTVTSFPVCHVPGSSSFTFHAFGNGNTPSDGGTVTATRSIASGSLPYTPGRRARTSTAASTSTARRRERHEPRQEEHPVGPRSPRRPANALPVTIEDGLASIALHLSTPRDRPVPTSSASGLGLNVNTGATYGNGFKVVITILGHGRPEGRHGRHDRADPRVRQPWHAHDRDGLLHRPAG